MKPFGLVGHQLLGFAWRSEDLFGLRFQFRLQITPVIPSLIQSPILGK
jgi:hypothetical protein